MRNILKGIKYRFKMWLMDWDEIGRCPLCWMEFHSEGEYKLHYKMAHIQKLEPDNNTQTNG